MHTQPLIIDTVDSLSQQLAAILENLEQMQQREKPYLLALYQANLGELEYKLLTMQVECRALQQRIQLAMIYLNRGECLTEQKLQAIDQQVKQDLLTWHTQLNEQAQMLSAGFAYLQDLICSVLCKKPLLPYRLRKIFFCWKPMLLVCTITTLKTCTNY